MTLRSPRAPAGGPLLEQERPELVAAEGANPPAARARDWTGKGEIAAKSCSYTHNRRMSHPRTHLQRVGGPDIISCPSSADRKRPQPRGHGRNGILKKTRPSVIYSFRICSFS